MASQRSKGLVDRARMDLGYQVEGIHKDNPREALDRAEAIFVGGGNTFLLLNTLYELDLLLKLSSRVAIDGVPYIGSSAGSNVASLTINNTNDMPIIHPPSFKALQLIPFNINPHYIDADKSSTHMGETREERILQFQELPHSVNVLGLREGAHLLIKGQSVALKGIAGGRLFPKAKAPRDVEVGSDLTYLLTGKIPN